MVILMVEIYYSERIRKTDQHREKVSVENSGGNQVQVSKSPVCAEGIKDALDSLSKHCDNTCKMLSSRKLIRNSLSWLSTENWS